MSNSNNKKTLFNDFPPVDTSQWLSAVEKDLKGRDFEKTVVWKTDENIDVQPFYREEHIRHLKKLIKTDPGEFPYIRGNNKNSYSWLIDVNIREESTTKSNKAAVNAIRNGADSVTFHQNIVNEENGIDELLKNIDLTKTRINFANAKGIKETSKLISNYSQKTNKHLNGCFFFDPVNNMVLNGENSNLENSFIEIKESILNCSKYLPSFKMFSIHSYPFKSSGGNIVQELAFTFNAAVEYITRLLELGLDIDSVCKRAVFSFSMGSSYFMEIAKLRAARLLWSKIIEQHNPESDRSFKMHIHAHTSHFNKTVYDPYVNILRGTTETMSAAIGGADSITVHPFDSYYKNSDQFSERVARNTQLIVREEAYLDKVADPGAGSYYIEKLTESISLEALNLFKEVELQGGLIESLQKGLIQKQLGKSRSDFEEKSYLRKKVFLGTNHYPNPEEKMADKIQESDFDHGNKNRNKTDLFIEPLTTFRASEPFEKIRFRTEKHARSKGNTPKVFLLQLGDLRKRRARANFSYNLFGCGGFEIIDNSGFETTVAGVNYAIASKAEIVVICSSNEEYPELVPEAVKALRTKNPDLLIVVAGYSKELTDKLNNCEIDDFIHTGTNTVEFLTKYLNKLGIE